MSLYTNHDHCEDRPWEDKSSRASQWFPPLQPSANFQVTSDTELLTMEPLDARLDDGYILSDNVELAPALYQ
jgi:hypothetical protein